MSSVQMFNLPLDMCYVLGEEWGWLWWERLDQVL